MIESRTVANQPQRLTRKERNTVDFLDALAQTGVGIAGMALLNHYGSHESWSRSLLFASLFMFCFWLARFATDRLPRRGRRDSRA
jgi:hypothetical protein